MATLDPEPSRTATDTAPAAPTPHKSSLVAAAAYTPLWRRIVTLSAPVMLAMLSQTLINQVDHVLVGHLPQAESTPGQTALQISQILLWMFGGFLSSITVGTQALTARRAGAEDIEGAGAVSTNSLNSIYVMEVNPSDLDVANGFDCVRLGTGDAANIAHLTGRDFVFVKHDVTNYIALEGDIGCMAGELCVPTVDIANGGGYYSCADPGTVPNDSGCNLTGDGTECESGQCAPAALMGIPVVAVCSPCNEDGDCGGGMTCQLPEVAIEGNSLALVPGTCV